jgi:class 3 adenylate cyclase/tetratricopeptide (TPR) repeat protein
VDTCATCGATVSADARFCPTCGSALGRTCPTCGEPVAVDARFCQSCGSPLEGSTPGAGIERKLVTVLFADVTGSTTLGEQLDPERLRSVMEAYFTAMRHEIEAEGGTVEKFIGDAVMAAFGVPTAHEDDPARAMRAGLRMLARLPQVNRSLESDHGVTLQIRIGLHTGEVLATVDPQPGEAMVTGDAVNAAARLQGAAEPGELLASERTIRAARGFAVADRGQLELRGKQERVHAFAVLEETGGPTRGLPGFQAPMVGRDAELDVLRSVYERAEHERRPHLVTIYGEAGVGKSRLTREFLSWADAREPRPITLAGRCIPYGDGITYWPLAEILKAHASILDSDPTDLAIEKVRKAGRDLLTLEVSADPARATAALAYTIGLQDPDVSFASLEPKDVRTEVHAAWRSFFTALGGEEPVVVVIEDIHWADPALLDLLEELTDRVLGSVVFLCPSRPDLMATRPAWGGGRRNTSSVALDPLTVEESHELIRLLLAVDDLPPSVHDRILERAEGNPFFLEEIIRRLVDGGLIERSGDRWRATEGIEEVEIPDTVQAVLAARIDLLDATDKRIVQAAAVVGRVFWPGPVADLTGTAAGDLDEALRRLEDRELILSRPGSSLAGQPEYIFKHVLTRDVAYESLPRSERPRAHSTVGRWLEQTAGDRAVEFAEVLAYHYATAAGFELDASGVIDPALRRAALEWLQRASDDARRRFVVKKAERLAEEAVGFAVEPLERVDTLATLAEAFFANYRGDLTWRYFREAALLAAELTPPDGRRVAYLAARACDVTIRWPGSMSSLPAEPEVRSLLELGLANLPDGDSEERVRLLGVRAGWPFPFPGSDFVDPESSEAAGAEAAEIAMRLGMPNLASGVLDNAASGWAAHGNYARTLAIWNRRGEVIGQVTEAFEIGDYWAMGAWTYYELGDYAAATRAIADGEAAVAGLAGDNIHIHLDAWKVATLHRLGRWDEALEWFSRVRDMLDERRERPPYFACHAYGAAAQIHTARGDLVQSDYLTQILAPLLSGASGRLYPWLLRLHLLRGDLSAASSLERPPVWRVHAGDAYESESELAYASADRDRATALLDEMRRHAEEAELPSVLAFADRLDGRLAIDDGDHEWGIERLTAAIDRFEGLGIPWERALTVLDLGRAQLDAGRRDEARASLTHARDTFERLGAVHDLAVVDELLR